MLDIGSDLTARQTTHQFVRERLRRAILRGSLPGGSRLVQAEIAAQLGVSTTPVREALRDLAGEGLIQLDAHRGAIVRELGAVEVQEIYDLRELLEPEAMRRAARRVDQATVDAAAKLLLQMEAEQDTGVWADLNREFHGLFVQAVGSSRMATVLLNLQDSAAPYVALTLVAGRDMIATANREHRQLLDCMRGGDGEGAAQVTRAHLRATVRALDGGRALTDPGAEKVQPQRVRKRL